MKTKILLIVGLLMFFTSVISSRGATQNASEKKKITVWNTPEVQKLTTTLICEYSKSHPNLEFKMMPLAAQQLPENLNKTKGVAFYSQESDIDLNDSSLLTMTIGRDVIVPVMNSDNPYYSTLEKTGVSVKDFRRVFTAGKADWGIILGNEVKKPVKIYVLDDKSAQDAVAAFLNVSPKILAKVETKPAKEIIRLVQKDKYAFGFCKLIDLTELGEQQMPEYLKLLPIDRNGNGQMDYYEKMYSSLEDFERGVWIGKYPGKLIDKIYSVSSSDLGNENVNGFLSWVVTDGQQFIESNGFSELAYNERQSRQEKLNPQQIVLEPTESRSAKSNPFLFIFIGVVAVVMVSGIVYMNWDKKKKAFKGAHPGNAHILNENVLTCPGGLYFDKTHTWVFMEKDGSVRMGIDDFLQHVTGKYTRVRMKSPGEKVKKNESVLSLIREGKQINIYAPFSGTIKEINEDLVTDPSLINRSPYAEGWIYMMEPSNWQREIRFFKIAKVYKEWLKSEFTRLKDFFAVFVKSVPDGNAQILIQDGGELKDGILADFGPEVWEDFQTNFIEKSE